MEQRRSVSVRSYRDVVDVVERRIFRVDRWRIPHPSGLSAAALGYFVALVVLVLVASKLPVVGQLLGALPPAIRLVGLPFLGAWALASWQVDGRRPHNALLSWARHGLGARTLSGLRRAPAVGSVLAPLQAIEIAPSGDESCYRRGRVRGPATVILRYPAHLGAERRRVRLGATESEPLAGARRVRVTPLGDRALPLAEGQSIRVPEGSDVVFD